MEYMEQQAQMALEGAIERERVIMADGYKAGMWKAITMLREGAMDYEWRAMDGHKIHISEGARFAATLLRSWANGIEIEVNKS